MKNPRLEAQKKENLLKLKDTIATIKRDYRDIGDTVNKVDATAKVIEHAKVNTLRSLSLNKRRCMQIQKP